MKTTVSQTGSYVPKWHGNRKEPESEQLIVEYDYLSWTERQKFVTKDKSKLILDDIETKSDDEIDQEVTAQHSKFELTFQTDDAGIVAVMHPRFKNFEDQNGNAIDTWAKLIKLPMTPENEHDKLIEEITRKLSGGAKEKNSKNSE